MTRPASQQPVGSEYAEFYQERAAIMEFDGGLSKDEAERRAWKETAEWLERNKARSGKQKQFFGQ